MSLSSAVYDKLQSLMALLRYKHQTARECRGLISQFLYAVEELRQAPMAALKSLAATMWS